MTDVAAVRVRPRHPLLADFGGLIGFVLVALLVVTALFAEQIAPYAPTEGSLSDARLPPAWQDRGRPEHLLGTDQLGQDIFSRVVYGSQVSLTVSFFGAALAAGLGVGFGLLAGYFGGWADTLISSAVNVMLSLPYVVLVIVIATLFGRSLLNVILIFGVTSSPLFVRFTRGEVLRLKREEYVQAALAMGANSWRVLGRHILPNMIGSVVTLATFEMSAMMIYESGLSFLGLSVPPQVPSWGNMLALGRQFLPIFPWMTLYPGLAIALAALGVNLLGDRVRELLDPRLRG